MNAQTKIVAADGWIAHDGLAMPAFAPGTMVNLCFADGLVESRPTSPFFWKEYWLRSQRAGRHIVAYRIVAPAVNLPARLDRIAERRAA